MATFGQDEKWLEAKRAVGDLNWLEIISYYRSINGQNVFVYSVVDGDKRLIVDVIDEDRVLLLNKHKEPVVDDYEDVMSSRKVFSYNDKNKEEFSFNIEGHAYNVLVEVHK